MRSKENKNYVIGVMSGTSLDGLDIAYCSFSNKKNWEYTIIKAETIEYNTEWKNKLSTIETKSALELALLDSAYGSYIGNLVNAFIKKNKINTTAAFKKRTLLIASHGHTIFHQPQKRMTLQIGSGAAIAAECNLPVVNDFRSKDVALGGQGAPLVPVGDALLFNKYNACINLGGFANISFAQIKKRIAYDICPVNIVLNTLANKLGKKYDEGGIIARKGKVNIALLKQLNQLPYYNQAIPKSLGKEWVLKTIYPLLAKYKLNPIDSIATITEHAALQIAKAIPTKKASNVLITGGGAYNTYLIERIKANTTANINIPDKNTVEFKEALIFAFLGMLRVQNKINTLKSVTGARMDSIGGAIYL